MSNVITKSYIDLMVQGGVNWLQAGPKHPKNPKDGDAYYNTSNDLMYVYDGNQWAQIGSNHTMSIEVSTLDVIASDDIYVLSIEGRIINLTPNESAKVGEQVVTGQKEVLEYLRERVDSNQILWIEKFIFDKMT